MKRLLALLLCLVLALSLIPAAAAEDIELVDVGETDELTETDDELITIIDPENADEPEEDLPEAQAGYQYQVVDSGTCGDSLTWTLFGTGLLQIDGSGAMYDYTRGGAPWYDHRDSITSLSIWLEVTHIGDYAFFNLYNMDWSVNQGGRHMPEKLKTIGTSAFLSCRKLSYLDFPKNVTSIGMQAFDYCYGLKRVTVRGTPSIGYLAFGDCSGLEEISFLSGVPAIDSRAFGSVSTDHPVSATAWFPPDNDAWDGSATQNYGGTLIWQPGYRGWLGENVEWNLDLDFGTLFITGSGQIWDFYSRVERDDSFATMTCSPSILPIVSKPTSVKIMEGVTYLGTNCLLLLDHAQTIELPSTLEHIAYQAINNCNAVKKLVIPAAVRQIDSYAFNFCNNLKTFRFLGHAPEMSHVAFKDISASINYYPLYSWTSDKLADYGGSLNWYVDDKIGNDAHWALNKYGKLTVSGTGTTDGYPDEYPVFYNFKDEIVSAEIANGITSLGDYLFYGMDGLKKIAIGSGVATIGQRCFQNCSALREIRFTGSAPSFGEYCFYGVTATALYPDNDSSWTGSVMSNYGGNLTWKLGVKPTITTQPTSKTAAVDTTVKFKVVADGAESYQWQYRKSSSDSWHNSTSTGNKTATLSVKATEARNGFQFRCKVKNAAGTTYSKYAKLTVVTKPVITTQPSSKTAEKDSTVKFTVAATGGGLSYQWQYRKSSTGTWYNSTGTGNKTATLSIKATEARNGFQFRCKVTNAAGTTNSSYAKLTVVTKPVITTQPTSRTVTAGTTVKFKVAATGGGLSYQWQYRKGSSGTWYNCTSTGAKTAEMTLTATAARNGFQFRCKVTNAAGTTYSSYAKLTVK